MQGPGETSETWTHPSIFSTSTDAVWAWQVIIEGREEQSDGGEKNKKTKHNPQQTTQSPQAESPPSCSLSSVLGETGETKTSV